MYDKTLCKECGKPFRYEWWHKYQPFCSPECQHASMRTEDVQRVCLQCGETFTRRNGEFDQKYCSRECYANSVLESEKTAIPLSASQDPDEPVMAATKLNGGGYEKPPWGLHVKIWPWEVAPEKYRELSNFNGGTNWVVKVPRAARGIVPLPFQYATLEEEKEMPHFDVDFNRFRQDPIFGHGELTHLRNGDAVIIWGERFSEEG